MLISQGVPAALLICSLAAVVPSQHRSPFFATVVGPDREPIAGAEVTCVFTPNLFAVGDTDVVTAVSDARGRVRCDLIVGRLYLAWAIGPADTEGVRCVSESVPLAAAGRVMELSAFERVAVRKVKVGGLAAWRDVGGVGLRWYPDGSQDLHVDLPMPAGDEVTLPPSPWASGRLGVRDTAGEVMVATMVEPDSSGRPEFAPPMLVRAVVRNDRGQPIADVLIEHCVGMYLTWGVFARSQRVDQHRVAGRTGADGTASFHVPKPANDSGMILQASRRDFGWQHQLVADAQPVRFILQPVEPTKLRVSGVDADVAMSATAGYFVRTANGAMTGERQLEVTSDGPSRWLVHAHGGGFIPRLAVAGKVPTAVIWDWVGQQTPIEIDVRQMNEVEVEVVHADGGPVAAGLGVMRGGGSVPLRWGQLLATDLAGKAKLWLPKGSYLIYASTGSQHAYQLVDGEAGGAIRLRLEPLPTMRVRVTDGDRPVSGARAEIVSVKAGGTEGPKMVAMYLSFNYAKMTHSDSRGEFEIRAFVLPGMKVKLKVQRGTRESEPFVFAEDGAADVVIRD